MREIKFRAWFGKTGLEKNEPCMVNGYDGTTYMEWIGLNPDGWDIKVMQYTGLKDKNGREIYEGDQLGHKLNVVYWESDGWCINGGTPLCLFIDEEVIGNIYENPELLK